MTTKKRLSRAVLPQHVVLIGFALYVLMPIYWLLVNATKSTGDLYTTFGFWLSDTPQLLENLARVVAQSDGIFIRWMVNTIWYSAAAATLATGIAAVAAYAFAKWRFRGRDVLFWIVICAMMVPGTALAVPTFQLASAIGIINTPWSVILPLIVNPFALYLLRAYITGAVPTELLEAARIDGAGEVRIFVTVVLRLIGPALATVFTLTFVATWNNYLLPLLMLSDSKLMPVTLGLANWNREALFPNSGSTVDIALVISGTLLSLVPIVIIFVFLQRFVRGGLTLGALK